MRLLAQASRQLPLMSDRTAPGGRAPALTRRASRGIAGRDRVEGHGPSIFEIASE
ncbi:MAG TPA: hypothetical protein VL919_11365 [Vicinamibacterales bacterium]|nr:hypothetical protein [Vicinamibacterales bacterium]